MYFLKKKKGAARKTKNYIFKGPLFSDGPIDMIWILAYFERLLWAF